ncbi:MAG: Ger(x)C family spore germination protein [Clostridiales bacterium]|nr:Ger(x)C family spore germination protein [Clostridiales bacterium]
MPNGKKCVLILCVLPFFFVTSCSIQKDIGKLILATAVAIDQSDTEDNGVKLTVETQKTMSASSSQGGAQKKPIILISQGQTVFDADRNFSAYTEKSLFWGHTQYIVVGESAARDDIRKYLDFFIRNHENRLNAHVMVVQEESGEELLKSGDEDLVTNKLKSLVDNVGDMSLSKEITLVEFVEALGSKYSAAYLPCLKIVEKPEGSGGNDYVQDIVLGGYAIFKGTRLQDFITGKEARGLNWVTGDVKSGIIVVKDKDGKDISLEIISAKTKIKTKLIDGIPNIEIKIKVNSNIGELEGASDVFNAEALSELARQQADVIREEISSVVEFAKQNNTDILGFGDKIFHQHPVQWEGIKDKWSELFLKTIVRIEVEPNISGVYNITKAVRSWEGSE